MEAKKLHIVPLGGLDRIGMNMTAVECDGKIVVIDCGVAFPDGDAPGVDAIVPDTSWLEYRKKDVVGFVITHGHEDHIGSLQYVLKDFHVPIYGTRFTIALIRRRLEDAGINGDLHECAYGDRVTLGNMEAELVRSNHSVPDPAMIVLRTPAGTLVHTGDFKVDYTPVRGGAIDLARLAEIGNEGVLALLCESTNAEQCGHTPSESDVGPAIDRLMESRCGRRIIIATFASNVDRVQQIVNAAARHGRRVVPEGRSMVASVTLALEMGYLEDPDGVLYMDDQDDEPPAWEDTVIIATGSQGESRAALPRMAADLHRTVTIVPGDAILFSSHPIPGNERAVSDIINQLMELGAEVVFEDAHVSGHARQDDIKLLYTLLRPRYAVPVHGEPRHLKAGADIARQMGLGEGHCLIPHAGDVIEIQNGTPMRVRGSVKSGKRLISCGVGVDTDVVRDRQIMSTNGAVFIAVSARPDGRGLTVDGVDVDIRGIAAIDRPFISKIHDSAWRAACRASLHGSCAVQRGVTEAVREAVRISPGRDPLIVTSIVFPARPDAIRANGTAHMRRLEFVRGRAHASRT